MMMKLFVLVLAIADAAAAHAQPPASSSSSPPLDDAAAPALAAAAAASAPLSGWYTGGTATFYGGPQDQSSAEEYDAKISTGSCGYGSVDPKLYPFYNVVGLAPTNPLLSGLRQRGCGTCIEVVCEGDGCHTGAPPLQALITDECAAGCSDLQVNLHVFAFELLAPVDRGSVAVRYRRVECAPVDPITIHVDAYRATAGGWLRLALKSVAGDAQLASIELASAAAADLALVTTYFKPTTRLGGRAHRTAGGRAGSGGAWRRLNNTFGAAWELNGVPPPPLHMRVTDAAGHAIVIADAIPRAGLLGDVETGAQFPPGAAYAKAKASPGARLAPPPGAALAPGTTDVLVFRGPDDAPLRANETSIVPTSPLPGGGNGGDGNGGNSSDGVAAEQPLPTAASGADGGGGGKNDATNATAAAAPSGPNATSADGPSTAAEDPAAAYVVAGFEDANGDGFADQDPEVVGMPEASRNASGAAAGGGGAPLRRRHLLRA